MLTIGRKALQLVVVFVVVTFFTVMLMSFVPGKPETVVVPFDNTPGEVIRKQFIKENNLDRALPVQWGKWAQRFVTGDMGQYYRQSSTEKVASRLWPSVSVSVALILYTMILSLLIAIPLAVLAAYRSGGWVDKIINITAFGMISLPSFVAALVLSYYLGLKLGWLPTQGYVRPTEDLVGHFKSVAIPVIALSLGQIAVYMRLLRSDLVATLQEDFILMAKSKGVSNSRVLWRHALRPSSLTILTVAGLNVGTLIGGTVVIETLLGIPGVGFLLGEAVLARQYVALQSLVAVIAIVFVLLNFAVDALYSVLDPRIRERTA